MKSRFAKWALGAFVMSAVAMMSVAPMAVYAEEGIATVSEETTNDWVITNAVWDSSTINYTAGTISVTVTYHDNNNKSSDYTKTVTANAVLEEAATCCHGDIYSFRYTDTEGLTGSVSELTVTSGQYENTSTKLKATFTAAVTSYTAPTCTTDGEKVTTYTCTCGSATCTCDCGVTGAVNNVLTEVIPATGHTYSDTYVYVSDPVNYPYSNIKVVDGVAVLDDEGVPVVLDENLVAYYYTAQTCTNVNNGEVCGDVKDAKLHVINPTKNTEDYIFIDVALNDTALDYTDGHLAEAITNGQKVPSNTYFMNGYSNGDGDTYTALLAALSTADSSHTISSDLIDSIIRLDDHTKSGTFNVIGYTLKDVNGDPTNPDNWTVTYVQTYTITKRHYETKWVLSTSVTDNASDYLTKNDDGSIMLIYDNNGNVIGAYNNHCSEDGYIYVDEVCVTDGAVITKAVKITADDCAELKATGIHEYGKEYTPTTKTYKDKDENVHYYSTEKKCVYCGHIETMYTATEAHEKEMVIEDYVQATCGHSGSYTQIIKCADCGRVFSTITVATKPTNAHVWVPTIDISGNTVIYSNGWDGSGITTKVGVSLKCSVCGDDGEWTEGAEGVVAASKVEIEGVTGYASLGYVYNSLREVCDPYKDGKVVGYLYVTVSEPVDTEYFCDSKEVVITATVYGTDVKWDSETSSYTGTVLDTASKTVTYYASVADYEARVAHSEYTYTEVKDGVTYTVTKCAICGLELSRVAQTSTDTSTASKLAAVTGLKASATVDSNAVTLTWNAVSGADYYLILAYRDGKYVGQIGYTASLKYVDAKASTDEYNFYWVVAYSKDDDVVGELCDYVYGIQPLAQVANLAATSANGTVTLTWDAVDRASYYKVMYGKSGSTLTTTTTTSTTYTDTTATAGEYSSYVVIAMYDTPSCGGVASVQSSSVTVLVQ
ncbi:MAG: hypothetical protein LUI14_13800 [Lachnospiraceae bacterium]|nr:hypothetical protein [Lachnospiraceae bacterium]